VTDLRILCVAADFPWPEVKGFRIRLANVVRALASVGEVDGFFVVNDGSPERAWDVPPDAKLARVQVCYETGKHSGARLRARWFTSGLPVEMLWRSWDRARTELEAFADRRYDVVWMGHALPFVALSRVVSGPLIVDLDNLEDRRLRYELDADDHPVDGSATASGLRSRVRRAIDVADVGRWNRLQRRIAEAAELVTLCSDLDCGRLGVPNCAVVPNGYDLVEADVHSVRDEIAPDEAATGLPVMLMVGDLFYRPNADGARWFVNTILPRVRRELPNAELHLVGRHLDDDRGLASAEGVSLLGFVPDVTAELHASAAVVVPLRSGGGTRIKVLEAFAHRVPVVSTTVGCEGLGVEDGVHALIADDPDGFARACVRVLTDRRLARSLADAAFELYEDRFRWSEIRPRIASLAARVAQLPAG
jgi:glycosyltransferase involved in cell wall biosynthesis